MIVLGERVTEIVFDAASLMVQRAAATVSFAAAYVGLDWVSFIHPLHGIDITPWSLADGLSFAVLLLGGYRWVPAVFLVTLGSSLLISVVPVPVGALLLGSTVISAVYGTSGELLRRLWQFDVRLERPSDLILLLAAAVVAP